MFGLGDQLKKLPNVQVTIFPWDDWQKVVNPISQATAAKDQIVVIGYSGGGTRATYLAQVLKAA